MNLAKYKVWLGLGAATVTLGTLKLITWGVDSAIEAFTHITF